MKKNHKWYIKYLISISVLLFSFPISVPRYTVPVCPRNIWLDSIFYFLAFNIYVCLSTYKISFLIQIVRVVPLNMQTIISLIVPQVGSPYKGLVWWFWMRKQDSGWSSFQSASNPIILVAWCDLKAKPFARNPWPVPSSRKGIPYSFRRRVS